MYGSDQDRASDSPPARPRDRDQARNARYTHLVGRLHSRQITMEEATELFQIMQNLLQTSEAARLALMRTPSAVAPSARLPPPPPERAAVAASAAGDELLLVGLLAMGAGAGLLAAMTKRIQDVTTPSPPTSNARPRTDPTSGSG